MKQFKIFFVAATAVLAASYTLPPSLQNSGTPIQLSPDQIRVVQDGIKARLKDPMSAMFSGETHAAQSSDGEITACGLVNAKNGFGGYSGASLYIVIMKNGVVEDADVDASSSAIIADFCRQRGVSM